jgi:DNA-binding response OmpR family regulator
MTQLVLIDDHVSYATSLGRQLEIEGYDVGVAHDAGAGLNLIDRVSPDFILLDLVMIGDDGYSVLRALQTRQPRIPTVVLSARTEDRCKSEALELGAEDYITKPVGIEILLARIAAILRRGDPGGDRDGGPMSTVLSDD